MVEEPARVVLKKDQFSEVWREGDWVYKRQHEFLADNEVWCLRQMWPSGYVPYVEMIDRDLIRTRFIGRRGPYQTDLGIESLMLHVPKMLEALRAAGIRHGDLTEYSILLNHNLHPYIIDFSESRLWDDPRPEKRSEGDEYWLTRTMRKLSGLNPIIGDFQNSGRL